MILQYQGGSAPFFGGEKIAGKRTEMVLRDAGSDIQFGGRTNYLDEHYTDKIPLDDLSEHFFINKFYLSKIFKETYGTTVNNYLISKRITRAKQLLRFTDMTVDEVGAAVGMGDANYFSRMFRKVEGISPREYRK